MRRAFSERAVGDRVRLTVLFERVEARVAALREAHPGWPCARGCDGCCRRLAAVPEIARPHHASW